MLFRQMVRKRRDGTFQIRLDEVEREAVIGICAELRGLLSADPEAPIAWRLFPDAYPDDPEQERFYQQMARGELLASRLAALEVVEMTASQSSVSRAELEQWMTGLNAVRLALGTALGVTDDPPELGPGDANLGLWATYDVLTVLLGSVVHALAES